MKLKEIKIKNFRSFDEETIPIDAYTCFVGSNGAGKSNILVALNVFFRDSSTMTTDVNLLSEEDFHHRDISQPIEVRLTFNELSSEAKLDLKEYVRLDNLIVSAKAEWDPEIQAAKVLQFGNRFVIEAFSEFFREFNTGTKVAELQEIYKKIRIDYTELPDEKTKEKMKGALRDFEENNPDMCTLVPSEDQFYGFTKGKNILDKYIQWVHIPAVKDASSEQEEGSKTALKLLLDRTIRANIKFDEPLKGLKSELEEKYKDILRDEKGKLDEVATALQSRLREWANPNCRLILDWSYDPSKSLVVSNPIAKFAIGDGEFLGEVTRLGHGLQRGFLVALLQELAQHGNENIPDLLLGFEEPELYQHPPQAIHLSDLLYDIATDPGKKSQILVTSHSPYFVPGGHFEMIRSVRKSKNQKISEVKSAKFDEVEARIANALGETPSSPSSLMARVIQILQPSQREIYFTPFAILVEGIEDVAFLSTHFHLNKRWKDFRELGCHFIVCEGKTNMSRLIAIALEMDIPNFTIFDSDSDKKPEQHRKDNLCILNLCGSGDADPMPTETYWGNNIIMWKTNIAEEIILDIGENNWNQVEERVRTSRGFTSGVRRKNSSLISATLEELWGNGIKSNVLEKTTQSVLNFASNHSE